MKSLFKNLSFNDLASLIIVVVFIALLIAAYFEASPAKTETAYTYLNGVRI